MPPRRRSPDDNFDRRLAGESAKAFAAFRCYCQMGAQRSIAAVAQNFTKTSPRALKFWSARFHWVTRAAAYDEHLAELEREAMAKQAEAVAAEWAERERALRERRYQLAIKLLNRAEKMLEFPLATVEHEDGRVIVSPAGWNMNTARLLALAGFQLASGAIRGEADLAEEAGALYEFFDLDFKAR